MIITNTCMRARWVPLKVNHAKSVVSKCRNDAKIETPINLKQISLRQNTQLGEKPKPEKFKL